MRVIAGEKRHLLLRTLEGNDIRPTTDMIKETLFNMIQFDIKGVSFLDAFAGSGAIGIEALSRGASDATFIDINENAIKVIKENLTHTGLLDRSEVIRGDASIVVESLSRKNKTYGIVFLDPPYGKKLYVPVLEKIAKSSLINNDTIIIVETNLQDDIDEANDLGYNIYKVKKYKSNKHIFMKKL